MALVDTIAPDDNKLQALQKYGLAIRSTDDNIVQFTGHWDKGAIDAWLHTLFPNVFDYIDNRTESDMGVNSDDETPDVQADDYPWVLLFRVRSKMSIHTSGMVDGYVLKERMGGTGKAWQQWKLTFGT